MEIKKSKNSHFLGEITIKAIPPIYIFLLLLLITKVHKFNSLFQCAKYASIAVCIKKGQRKVLGNAAIGRQRPAHAPDNQTRNFLSSTTHNSLNLSNLFVIPFPGVTTVTFNMPGLARIAQQTAFYLSI